MSRLESGPLEAQERTAIVKEALRAEITHLGDRVWRVAAAIIDGVSIDDLGAHLNLTKGSVSQYLALLRKELGVPTTADAAARLVRVAAQHGLLESQARGVNWIRSGAPSSKSAGQVSVLGELRLPTEDGGWLATGWTSLEGAGEFPLDVRLIKTELDATWVSLPDDLEALRADTAEHLERLRVSGQSHIWNGKRFALREILRTRYDLQESPGLWFKFQLTDYAAYVALTLQMDEPGLLRDDEANPVSIRQKYFKAFDPDQPNPYLTHSFGVSLLVITEPDERAIFVQRNAHVATGRNLFNVSVNEGMQYPRDVDGGRPSFVRTAKEGLLEELGLSLNEEPLPITQIEFLNFGVLHRHNEHALIGCVRLPLSADEVELAYVSRAKDRGLETRHELHAVDLSPDSLIEFVNNNGPWVGSGLATLYYTMLRMWGYALTREALLKRPLRSTVVVGK